MATFIVLLRGINVGGKKPVKMAALKAVCERSGFTGVRTLLQSGNVVMSGKAGKPAAIATKLASAIENEFGFSVGVLVRASQDLAALIEANPFAGAASDDPSHLVVMFLDRDTDADTVAALAKGHTGPEEIATGDRCLYIHYRDGIGRSKLTNAVLERRLDATGTARNWNTVTRLLAMAEA